MTVRSMIATVALLAVAACEAAPPTATDLGLRTALAAGPTLLVTNATCAVGSCIPIEVRAFIPQWRVPGQPPDGVPFMGWVRSRVVCLRFPVADTFRTIGVNSAGIPVDTALTIWTPDSSVALFAVASAYGPLAGTTEFVPGSSPGWNLTVPNGAADVAPAPGEACTP